ncbi:PREDICTED: zinc metalloproteinase nas-4-like [Priapulus caudatus]|uniref:Metalloendopeptidase n=1 Tax=Priapulus caudatus TaxID=37621 RepID=A0ABM1F6W8_PRICU|nr:PREDICTED: zinc metalloproteinase nas-4-like [Priapulus caudatus]
MTVQHEMMHCMGFYHTQSRADRDSYVRIYLQNVMQGQEHNFDKVSTSVASLYGAYDLLSIMHYDCYSFSKNGYPTITSLNDPSCQTSLGQPHVGGGFRNSDVKKLNDMYC